MEFEYFGWDEAPIGKYKQPKPNPGIEKHRQGYPADEMDLTGTKSFGRYVNDGYSGKKKDREEIRGCKNTQRGKRFYNDFDDRNTTPAAPDKGRSR